MKLDEIPLGYDDQSALVRMVALMIAVAEEVSVVVLLSLIG